MCWSCEFILTNKQLVYKIKILSNDTRGPVGGKTIAIDGGIDHGLRLKLQFCRCNHSSCQRVITILCQGVISVLCLGVITVLCHCVITVLCLGVITVLCQGMMKVLCPGVNTVLCQGVITVLCQGINKSCMSRCDRSSILGVFSVQLFDV